MRSPPTPKPRRPRSPPTAATAPKPTWPTSPSAGSAATSPPAAPSTPRQRRLTRGERHWSMHYQDGKTARCRSNRRNGEGVGRCDWVPPVRSHGLFLPNGGPPLSPRRPVSVHVLRIGQRPPPL